jgi:hypothetical protein
MFEEEPLSANTDEIAIALNLTHEISADVRSYVTQRLPQVTQIIHCRFEDGGSPHAIRSGSHAWRLAQTVVNHLATLRTRGRRVTRVHLFMAGPNGFAFFLGQQQRTLVPTTIYEWDLEHDRDGGYSAGLSLNREHAVRAALAQGTPRD